MKNIKKFISKISVYTAYTFSISIIVFIVIGLIIGIEGMTIGMLMQLLILCILSSMLQIIIFSDLCLKKLSYIKRLIIFMFLFLAIITAFAVRCEWFSVKSIEAWIMFMSIFIICFAVITIIFEVSFRATGNKYTGILNEYKKKKLKQ